MAWIIDQDHVADDEFPEGTNLNAVGKRSRDKSEKGLFCKFKMFDDDGNLYYEGRADEIFDMSPLDDFGKGNAGCTEIRYLQGEEWVPC